MRKSIIFLFLFVCLFAACGGPDGERTTGTSASPNDTGLQADSTPGVKAGAQSCPETVSATTYWDQIVPTQAGINKVEKVSCANFMGTSELQALILVRTVDGHTLDAYVYNNITSPAPNRIFELLNLYGGDVQISAYNSLMTAEINVSNGKPDAQAQPNVFREFKWNNGVATLVPVAFPGLSPLTRYQATKDQQAASKGQGDATWWLDAKSVAQHFVADTNLPLKWPADTPVTLASGGGTKDASAVVNAKSPSASGGMIKLTMQRLQGNTNGGIWIITAVETAGLAITTPQSQDHVINPVAVTGKGNAFEGVIGTVDVLDDTYTSVTNPTGGTQATGAQGEGSTTFSASVSYNSPFKTGKQEGLVVLYTRSSADGAISGLTVVKVLLA